MIKRRFSIAIAVADPKRDDYADLLRYFPADLGSLFFVSSGRAALALGFADAWIVNTALPDMSGFDLCEALKARFPRIPLLFVDDSYQVENELRARSCGGAMYACKPLQPASLVDWWQSVRVTKEATTYKPGRAQTRGTESR